MTSCQVRMLETSESMENSRLTPVNKFRKRKKNINQLPLSNPGPLRNYYCSFFDNLPGKIVGEDKKLYKTLESKYIEEMESEVPDLQSTSPFGPLTHQASRKTLYHLIATLNASFPDYDFR
jgi:hypothetical protein